MTDLTINDGTPAPDAQLSMWGKIHADARHVWTVFSRLFPLMERIALNPALDQLFTEALQADGAAVAAEYFQAATDQLRAARLRQQAGQPPAPTAADLGPAPAAQPPADPAATTAQPQLQAAEAV